MLMSDEEKETTEVQFPMEELLDEEHLYHPKSEKERFKSGMQGEESVITLSGNWKSPDDSRDFAWSDSGFADTKYGARKRRNFDGNASEGIFGPPPHYGDESIYGLDLERYVPEFRCPPSHKEIQLAADMFDRFEVVGSRCVIYIPTKEMRHKYNIDTSTCDLNTECRVYEGFVVEETHFADKAPKTGVFSTTAKDTPKWMQKKIEEYKKMDYDTFGLAFLDPCTCDETFELVKANIRDKTALKPVKNGSDEYTTLLHDTKKRKVDTHVSKSVRQSGKSDTSPYFAPAPLPDKRQERIEENTKLITRLVEMLEKPDVFDPYELLFMTDEQVSERKALLPSEHQDRTLAHIEGIPPRSVTNRYLVKIWEAGFVSSTVPSNTGRRGEFASSHASVSTHPRKAKPNPKDIEPRQKRPNVYSEKAVTLGFSGVGICSLFFMRHPF